MKFNVHSKVTRCSVVTFMALSDHLTWETVNFT